MRIFLWKHSGSNKDELRGVELSRFDAAPLIAFTATKEMNYALHGRVKATTDSNHKFNIAPNLLDRDFSADQPNQKWAGDIKRALGAALKRDRSSFACRSA